MQDIEKLKGAGAIVQNKLIRFTTAAVLVTFAAFLAACGGPAVNNAGGTTGGNETAATVNGKVITMEEVDRGVKIQAQGQMAKMSPLELASARLQVLEGLIQQEVMFQKAEKEQTVPTEDEITAEINKQKTQSGKSADQIEKEMKDQGIDEATLRVQVKKALATQKLVEKVTGKIEPPKDSEIEAFYNGNKDAFVKKRGVKVAAIIIDPSNSGEGDQTIDEPSAILKANEVVKKLQTGQDFASVARENSEDQSKFQGGDLGYLTEDDLKQAFPEQTVAALDESAASDRRDHHQPLAGQAFHSQTAGTQRQGRGGYAREPGNPSAGDRTARQQPQAVARRFVSGDRYERGQDRE